jgi:HEPN domain-containing protein
LIILGVLSEFERADLKRVLERADRLKHFGELRLDKNPLQEISRELNELEIAVYADLSRRTFSYLEDTAEPYYEQSELFGSTVAKRFPKAAYDIREAGSCYSTGRYTACVFHLMRALEHALRELARRLKVPFPSKFEGKTWGKLIGDIEDEIQKIILKPGTPKRAKDLEFYNSIAAQFRYFKDGWRNHVMHTRGSYDEHQAKRLLVHVEEFMRDLATH